MARSILSAGGRVLSQGGRVLSFEQNTLDPDLTTYITGLVTPLSAGQLTLLNNFITTVKTGLSITNLSDAFDVMYILANETSEAGLRNLVKRSHDAQLVNTVAFTALEGFTGNGTNSYIRTNWIGSTQASAYELNSASFGIYFRTTTDKASFELHGVWDTSGSAIRIQLFRPNGFNNSYGLGLNSTGQGADGGAERISGMYVGSRDAASSQKLYVNKVAKATGNATALSIPNQEVLVSALRTNSGGTLYFENDQISLIFLGKGLSQAEVNVITDAFQAYMTANGKQV